MYVLPIFKKYYSKGELMRKNRYSFYDGYWKAWRKKLLLNFVTRQFCIDLHYSHFIIDEPEIPKFIPRDNGL